MTATETLTLTPSEQLAALETSLESSPPPADALVAARQKCLALAQLACGGDRYQLGRACCNLARAYLEAGGADAALRHAERAEALLLGEAGRAEAAALLPEAMLTLACAHAESTARLRPAADDGKMRADERAALEARYKRAAQAFLRALAASKKVFGRDHPSCCPILRGWARMEVQRKATVASCETALELLRRETAIREAQPRAAAGDDADALLGLAQERGELMLRLAGLLEAKGGGESARVRELRAEAVALLGEGGGVVAPVESEAGAALALRLAQACAQLEQWPAAEAAYLRALPYTEEKHGMTDRRVLELWEHVAAARLRQQKYAAAAADYAHLLSMQGVLHGRDAVELIPTAEALAKAHVFLRDFGAAKAELTRAHEIAAARYGKDDRRTKRIAEVLESVQQHVVAAPAAA